MVSPPLIPWLILRGLILVIMMGLSSPHAHAAPDGARLVLRPHCEQKLEESAESGCPLFSIRDPLTRETPILKKDDLLDMDLVLIQDSDLPIHRVRTWLAYDPNILEGDLLETSTDFPETAPGEKDFVPSDGYIKIDVSTPDDAGKTQKEMLIARIRMRVRDTPTTATPISFYDVSQEADGHTLVMSGESSDARNILFPELGSLLVRLDTATTTPPIAQQIKMPPPPPVFPSSVSTKRPDQPLSTTPFTLLQVQNVAVTTEGTNIFFGWDPLSTPDLIGYNVYYASRSGEYLHKRSLDATATSTTVRDLPIGVKYFFAIRGINRAQQESAFSLEVAVAVGSPATSTSPLAASMIPHAPPALRTPLNVTTVPGQTGISSWLVAMTVGVALLGTILAVRKQLLLS